MKTLTTILAVAFWAAISIPASAGGFTVTNTGGQTSGAIPSSPRGTATTGGGARAGVMKRGTNDIRGSGRRKADHYIGTVTLVR
jgi:hypothetical protein